MLKARLNYEVGWDAFSLWVTDKRPDGTLYFLKLETIQSSIAGENAKPFIEVGAVGLDPKEFCQAIMDTAWENGMRPSGFKDVEKETKAIKGHLNDMRRLVFSHITPYNIVELKE